MSKVVLGVEYFKEGTCVYADNNRNYRSAVQKWFVLPEDSEGILGLEGLVCTQGEEVSGWVLIPVRM